MHRHSSRLRRALTACIPFVLACLVSAPAADIYKWKDADGNVHVSDQPPADGNGERLKIRTYAGSADQQQSSKNIVMLSASWCGVCKQARAWMTANAIPFTEHDVEKSETGKTEFRRLGGTGVPIILVGDSRMNGFSAERLKSMLKEQTQ